MANRLIGDLPKIGIRPVIDGRERGVREALEKEGIPMAQADVTMIPQTWVELTDEQDIPVMEEEARTLVALGVEARAFKASAKNRLLEFSPDDEATIEHLIAMSKRALSRRE